MPAAGRAVRLPVVILPAARPLRQARFAAPRAAGRDGDALDCRHGGERRRIKPGEAFPREALDAADLLRPSTCRAAAAGPMPVVRSAVRALDAGMVARGASIKPDESGEAFHGEALDARDVSHPSTCHAATPGPMPVARSAARPSIRARWRATTQDSAGPPALRYQFTTGQRAFR
jgi:hypothetical protein